MEALLRPLRHPHTPRAFAFFLLALPLGIFYFTFLMTVLSVGLPPPRCSWGCRS